MNIFSKTFYKSGISKNTKEEKLAKTYAKNPNTNDEFILGKDETLKPNFTKIFGSIYEVNIYYLKIKSPELNLEKTKINIYLPFQYKNNNNQKLLDAILLKMYTKIAEKEIENIMEEARHIFGFAPEDYEIKKMQNILAYCNKELQSITINPQITMYSHEIIRYVIFHEFCHLKYKTHSKKFYELLKTYIPNYEKIAKQIPNLKY